MLNPYRPIKLYGLLTLIVIILAFLRTASQLSERIVAYFEISEEALATYLACNSNNYKRSPAAQSTICLFNGLVFQN